MGGRGSKAILSLHEIPHHKGCLSRKRSSCTKRGHSEREGAIRFCLCVCDVFSPRCCVCKRSSYTKRGHSEREGAIRFCLCVCDVFSPWCCLVSEMTFCLIYDADREGVFTA